MHYFFKFAEKWALVPVFPLPAMNIVIKMTSCREDLFVEDIKDIQDTFRHHRPNRWHRKLIVIVYGNCTLPCGISILITRACEVNQTVNARACK